MTVLLTGFEPFRQWTVNSSGEVARALAGRDGLVTAVLPVDHITAAEELRALIARHQPRAILATGLSPRAMPRLELCARRPEGVAAGPALLAGIWPWAAALGTIRAEGLPVALSRNAGRYVCETVYWTALEARRTGAPVPVGFLHMPPLGGDWPLDRLCRATRSALLPVLA